MSEVQKELTKAKTNEDAGNFDKAARNYFKAAEITNDLKLYNKAFFTSRKSGRTDLMYDLGKSYYDMLIEEDQENKIKELIPTFLEISGRERDRLSEQSPEELITVLDWTSTLYQLIGNMEAAYDTSQQTGDAYFSSGQKFLTTTHRLGKEEKWQRGLDLFDNAVEAFQQIRLDTQALEKIFAVKLDKISRLIDIGRHVEGIEDTTSLMDYYGSQAEDIVPYSKEVLSLKIAELFSEKSLNVARNKKFEIADVLMKTTKAGFENAGKYTEIAPYLWQLALIYDEFKQNERFFPLVETTFDTALKYEEDQIQQSILGYLEMKGKEICNNVLNSRMLMVKKGPIEFPNNQGVQYLLKTMDLCKGINNIDIPDQLLDFLFQYAQDMYTKKLAKRSLPYFEYCAQTWWDLSDQGKPKTRTVIDFLKSKSDNLLTIGKFDNAAIHLGTIIAIQMFMEEVENAGNSAFSFAQAAGQQGKQNIELEFLERAYDAFFSAKNTAKLQDMLNYITQQLDPLFNLDSKSIAPREKFIQLGDLVTAAISEQAQGEFLKATTFKALNTGLFELGINTADKAFDVTKKYNPKEAADIYFRVGSSLLETDMEKSLEFITKSTKFAVEQAHEALEEVIEHNLNYLQERTLTNPNLSTKLFLVKKLELLTEMVGKVDKFNEFLFIFTQNLAEKADEKDFFTEMKNFLSKTFYGFHVQDPNHSKLSEIITWTNAHILEAYTDTQLTQMYELAIQNLAFHENLNQIQECISFFWKVYKKFVSAEDFSHAIAYYKQTYETLERLKQSKEVLEEITGQAVAHLDRGIKPKIADEAFDDAWPLIEGLFSILSEAGLHSQAVNLYETNAKLFAPHRLDLALTMWNQAIDTAKGINDTKSIETIASTIADDITPGYVEKGVSPAVNQLYTQAVAAYQAIRNTEATLNMTLQAARFNLSLGDFETIQEWGQKGFQYASETKNEEALFEFANMFFAVGRGLLTENPDVAIKLIDTASNYLRDYGEYGFDLYCTKMAEIYEDLYNSPSTQQFAQNERTNILQHFKDSGNKKEEGSFLVTTAKLSFQAGNVNMD